MSLSSPSAEHRSSDVAARLVAMQESMAKKSRELDAAHSSHARQALQLRTLFAHYLLRCHIRAHKQKRLLMNLHLTAMEMQETLDKEEKRRATHEHRQMSSAAAAVVYDQNNLPSKGTLRRLAHLYRKRPLLIVAELDERFTHDVKGRFFHFLNDYDAVCRENEALFLRNVQLTDEALEARTSAEEDRRGRERWEKEAREVSERCDAAERELEELRRRVGRMEREEEVRKRKEAARALQIRTEGYSRGFQKGGAVAAPALTAAADAEGEDREAEAEAVAFSPRLSPGSPRSPAAFFASVPTSPRSKPLGSLHSLPSLPSPLSRAGPSLTSAVLSDSTLTSPTSGVVASPSRSSANKARFASTHSSQRPASSSRPLNGHQQLSVSSSDEALGSPLSPLSPGGGKRSSSRSPYASSTTSGDGAGAGSSSSGLPSITSPSSRRAAQRHSTACS